MQQMEHWPRSPPERAPHSSRSPWSMPISSSLLDVSSSFLPIFSIQYGDAASLIPSISERCAFILPSGLAWLEISSCWDSPRSCWFPPSSAPSHFPWLFFWYLFSYSFLTLDLTFLKGRSLGRSFSHSLIAFISLILTYCAEFASCIMALLALYKPHRGIVFLRFNAFSDFHRFFHGHVLITAQYSWVSRDLPAFN